MSQLYDFHVHTSYCDGRDTPTQMVNKAVEQGFEILGFSGHGFTDFDESFCMSRIRTDSYIDEISRLKEQYRDKLQILCGIEQDYFSSHPTSRFDYVIGSVHYLYLGGRYYPLDISTDITQDVTATYYDGDFSAMAADYFALVGDVVNKTDCDIIGHFDLITKFEDRITLTKNEAYYKAAFDAVKKLIPYKKLFEINLGAIARGYRSTPYPDALILKEINRLGGDIIITGDCHDRAFLGANYKTAADIARECGFTRRAVLTKDGVEYRPL